MKKLVVACAVVGCNAPADAPNVVRIDPDMTPVLVASDLSRPLREITPITVHAVAERDEERRPPILRAATPDFIDPVAQTIAAAATAPSPSVSFDGVGDGFTGPAGAFTVEADPPDTNGDVGPNHYVESVNISFAVFSKTGTPLYGPAAIDTVWSGFGGPCETSNDGDPLVKYDAAADRWLLSQFAVTNTNMECIAVSATGDPLGQWHRYAFSYTVSIDYPKMGVWPDAYYFTQNTDTGTTICAFERAAMLSGGTARSQCFTTALQGMMPANASGQAQPAAGDSEYVLAIDTDALDFWKLHVDWTTAANSSLTGPTKISVAAFSQPSAITQPGTSTTLDAISEQLMYGVEWRKFGDHESLVASHTVGSGGRIGVRWYELRDPSGTPTVFDQGTYVPDANQRWMGSINIDKAGDIALGFSVAGGTKPSIHYAARTPDDAAGMIGQAEATLIDGTGVKTDTVTLSRWGDYSTMSVDPSDECTFWYAQEYLTANGANWHTRIGSFQLAGCTAAGGGGSGSGSGSGSGGSGSGDGGGGAHAGGCSASGGGGWLLALGLVVFSRGRRRRTSSCPSAAEEGPCARPGNSP